MPRENIHWLVLEQAQAASAENLKALLSANPGASKLGAVAHDAAYFLDWGRSLEFNKIGESLHGSHGEDTLDPMRAVAEQILKLPKTKRQTDWAFLLGLLSHIATDVAFHPMVYYLTGNYSDPDPAQRLEARRNHRLFETCLDLWAVQNTSAAPFPTISEVLAHLESPLIETSTLLSSALGGSAPNWSQALCEMAKLQKWFISPAWGLGIRSLSLVYKPLFQYETLFSFGRNGKIEIFDSPIAYRNPVTGEEYSKTALELIDQSVKATLTLWQAFSPLICGETKSITPTLSELRGASLNVGVVGAAVEQYKFFSAAKNFL